MTDSNDEPNNVFPIESKMEIYLFKNNSLADGTSTNRVIATLVDDGYKEKELYFTLKITEGSATFINGTQTTSIKANPALVAAADFVDLVGETGRIIGYPATNNELTDEKPYTFKTAAAIDLIINTDNQLADDQHEDQVTGVLTLNDGTPYTQQYITFTLPDDSTASFRNNSKTFKTQTSDDGKAIAYVRDSKSENVTVKVTYDSDVNITKQAGIHFIDEVPIGKFTHLSLEVTSNNARADGVDTDHVRATLTDSTGALGKNITLVFTIPENSPAAFKNTANPKQFSMQTNDNGQASADIFSTGDTAFKTTISCYAKVDKSVKSSIDITFKNKYNLDFEITQNNALAILSQHNAVRAVLDFPEGHDTEDYVVDILLSPLNPMGIFGLTLPNKAPSHSANITQTVNVDNKGKAYVDAWVWDFDVNATEGAIVAVNAYVSNKAKKTLASNEGLILTFKPQNKPAPPPVDDGPVVIERVSYSSTGLTGTVTFKTVYQNTGKLAPNREVLMQGGASTGGSAFGWIGAETPNFSYVNRITVTTNQNGLATLNWKMERVVSSVEASAMRDITGNIWLYP